MVVALVLEVIQVVVEVLKMMICKILYSCKASLVGVVTIK